MKRDELLSTVPMSISVLAGDRLVASGISDISGIAAVTPGVEYDFSSQFGPGISSHVATRGIRARRGDATTGVYINDTPIQMPHSVFNNPYPLTFDLARVEVLHGPQGVLFGRSTEVSGTVNIPVPVLPGNHSCTEMAIDKHTLVERLFAEHGRALRSFLARRVRRQPDAAELAQEVFLRMLRLEDSSIIANPEAYLYTVASNLAKEHSRLEGKSASALDIDEPLVQQQLAVIPSFSAELDQQQRVKRLREVLRQLPVKCHAAVVLQYWYGLSYEEIAQQLGVSANMVKKYLSQAMVHCRKRMARLG